MEGKCKKCNRLIFDTEKLEELKDRIECQHCHHVNVIRQAGVWCFGVKKKKKTAPAPKAKKKIKATPTLSPEESPPEEPLAEEASAEELEGLPAEEKED